MQPLSKQPKSRDESSRAPIVELTGIEKRFGSSYALRDVSLSLAPAQVHAIVGENGAGKSTLIKILTGAYRRTSGDMRWKGKTVSFQSPKDALQIGIYAVSQEMLLCSHLTVAENLFLGNEESRIGFLRSSDMEQRAQAILDDLQFPIYARALVADLSIGQRQLVAIARASIYKSEFVIFDEPTSYLSRSETELLFKLIRRFRDEGRTIVYITHRMEEIFELAETVSVLRDGRLLSSKPVSETNPEHLVSEMAARPVGDIHHKETVPIGSTLLDIQALSGPGFSKISMTVRKGEIVGIFGLVGSGRSEFVRALFGRTHAESGVVKREGKVLKIRSERDAIAAGIALIPESRRLEGLCLDLDVRSNLSLASLTSLERFGFMSGRAEKASAGRWIDTLKIATASDTLPVERLSGGNQQKVVIGKWLAQNAKILIFDEPTVGVDVAAKAEIYKTIAQLLHDGAGVIIISSYLPEVYDLADTLHVFREGQQVASFGHKEVGQDAVLAKAIGA